MTHGDAELLGPRVRDLRPALPGHLGDRVRHLLHPREVRAAPVPEHRRRVGEQGEAAVRDEEAQNQEDLEAMQQELERAAQQAMEQSAEAQEQEGMTQEQALAMRRAQEQQQAMEQWLRRIPNDPGGLLRRKFRYQYQRQGRDQDGNNLWPDNEEQPW